MYIFSLVGVLFKLNFFNIRDFYLKEDKKIKTKVLVKERWPVAGYGPPWFIAAVTATGPGEEQYGQGHADPLHGDLAHRRSSPRGADPSPCP